VNAVRSGRVPAIRLAMVLGLSALGSSASAGQTASAWWPARGTVILGGGAIQEATAEAFEDRLIALAGGPDAVIVVIPTASTELPGELPTSGPQPQRINDLRKGLEARGARHVVFLHTRDRRVANSEAFVQVLRTANAVFLPGGASRVLDETYHGTLVERELKALLARGGVLAGDSAGAITLGCFWLGWTSQTSPFGKITDGLGVLPLATVTPHIRKGVGKMQDEMLDSLYTWVRARPPTVAVNIEENTMLILRGSRAEVLGTGAVTVFDAARDRTKPYLRLTAGAERELSR
jgi:cyanophycinase